MYVVEFGLWYSLLQVPRAAESLKTRIHALQLIFYSSIGRVLISHWSERPLEEEGPRERMLMVRRGEYKPTTQSSSWQIDTRGFNIEP